MSSRIVPRGIDHPRNPSREESEIMSVATVCVSGPAELAGIVQNMLGYVPSRSVVLLGTTPRKDGKHHVVVGCVVELDRCDGDDAAPWAAAFDAVERAGATAMEVVVYERDHGDGARILPGFSRALGGRCLRLGELVRVLDGRAYSADDVIGDGCLGAGTVVPTGADLPAAATLVALGIPAPAGSLAELMETYRAGSAPRERVAAIEAACQEFDRSDCVVELLAGLAMILDVTTGPIDGLPTQALAAALVALERVEGRDGALKWLLPHFMPDGEGGDAVAGALTAIVGRDGFHPRDDEEALAMRERLRVLLTHCPRHRSAQVAAVVGAYLWRLGDGVMARRVWEAGQDVEPDSVMLTLLLAAIGRGIRYPLG